MQSSDKYKGAAHTCSLRYNIPKQIAVVLHNGTHDYHFMTKELVKEFEGQVMCLVENTDKYVTFSVPKQK